jgi:hypothetical protein
MLNQNERNQEIRMRCLDLANRGPFAGTKEVTQAAQAMYDFAIGARSTAEVEEANEMTPAYRAYDAIFEHVPSLDFGSFKALVTAAGLEIVEKDERND